MVHPSRNLSRQAKTPFSGIPIYSKTSTHTTSIALTQTFFRRKLPTQHAPADPPLSTTTASTDTIHHGYRLRILRRLYLSSISAPRTRPSSHRIQSPASPTAATISAEINLSSNTTSHSPIYPRLRHWSLHPGLLAALQRPYERLLAPACEDKVGCKSCGIRALCICCWGRVCGMLRC